MKIIHLKNGIIMDKQLKELQYECARILAYAHQVEYVKDNFFKDWNCDKPIQKNNHKSTFNFGNGLINKLNKCTLISQYKIYSELKNSISVFKDGNALNGLDDDYSPEHDYQQLNKLFLNCFEMFNFIDSLNNDNVINIRKH
jgi:hypothetical protein